MLTRIEISDSVGKLILSRPRTNSLNHEFLVEIYNRICAFEVDANIHYVVILSDLPFGFSSGLDLGAFFSDSNKFAANVFNAVQQVYEINKKIISSPKIYLAGLSGPVIGSAASFVFSCDFRLAATNTWFWLPDPQYGGLLADGGLELLVRLVGLSKAKMFALTNERINAAQAFDSGMINKLYDIDKLHKSIDDFVSKLLKYSYDTISYSKQIMNSGLLPQFHNDALNNILQSGDLPNRMSRFL